MLDFKQAAICNIHILEYAALLNMLHHSRQVVMACGCIPSASLVPLVTADCCCVWSV